MAIKIPRNSRSALAAIVTEINRMRDAAVGSNFHACATHGASLDTGATITASVLQVTAANGDGTLAKLLLLVNNIKNVLLIHFRDTLAHNTAVSTAGITALAAIADATDLATAQTLLNACKTQWGTHLAEAGVHFNNDATNTIAAANMSNQATGDTLANEMKTDINAHINGALAGNSFEFADA
jgi:hypothetical protein